MKGLDCGTGNYVAATKNNIRLQRNAFLTIAKNPTTKKSLKRLNIPFVEINNRVHVVGRHAYEYAQIFGNSELRRPMASGLLNPQEQDAFPVLRLIIKDILGPPSQEDELCVYCVPGKPIDNEHFVDYHEDVLKQLIESLGYKARSLNEGEALAFSGLADDDLTGISISMGAGMCNICIMYGGMSALNFSVARGGDFIDENVARDCAVAPAKAQYIKEHMSGGIDQAAKVVIKSGKAGIKEPELLTREEQAVKTYYGVLIRYLLANIAKQFNESSDMPNFPNPVPMVVGGGTSMMPGFIDIFNEQFAQQEFPINISKVVQVDEPLTAVARGCLADAILEDEED
jgi:actin-like ATPase involved in cell morphogenesis